MIFQIEIQNHNCNLCKVILNKVYLIIQKIVNIYLKKIMLYVQQKRKISKL